MVERTRTHIWLHRILFTSLCLLIMYLQILPLETTPRRWAGPDLLLIVCIAWSLRRPEYAPILLIAGIMLLADLMFLRPPGLFAALSVITCEMMRRRVTTLRDMPFLVEWVSAAGAITAIHIGYHIILTLMLVDQPPLGLSVIQAVMSVLAYPFIVLFCLIFLGLRKAAPHDLVTHGGQS